MVWLPLPEIQDYELDDYRQFRAEYSGKVRFLVDENMGDDVAEFLRGGGFNAKFIGDYGMCGHPDENVFNLAWKERRVIVTHDLDFMDNRSFPPHRNPGIIRIGPGADGTNVDGLKACLVIAVWIAGDIAQWYVGRKLDFTSRENIVIYDANGTKTKYRWPPKGPVQYWQD